MTNYVLALRCNNRSGIVASIELTPLPDSFQSHRISEPMTARK